MYHIIHIIFWYLITAILFVYFLDFLSTASKCLTELAKNSKEIKESLYMINLNLVHIRRHLEPKIDEIDIAKQLPPKYYTLEK
jgi:hypothetical protein